ncbi:MAG: pyrroline-5-carboxylate reductase [Alphaproteobacteria bacterium]
MNKKILLIGCGRMGSAMLKGWLAADMGCYIVVVDPSAPQNTTCQSMQQKKLGACYSSLAESLQAQGYDFEAIILAVKPAMIADMLQQIIDSQLKAALILSVAAGKKNSWMRSILGTYLPATLVRVMPNLPMEIGHGVSVCVAEKGVTPESRQLANTMLSAAGMCYWLEDEKLMDAVTALSGSGPAYVFLLIELLAKSAQKLGLPPELADKLAVHTVKGAGMMAALADRAAEQLRAEVTSPNGTTASALNIFMRDDALATLVDGALAAACKRSQEMSDA